MIIDNLIHALSQPLNVLFIVLSFSVLAWAAIAGDISVTDRLKRLRTAPGVLISIGILGTFTGILIGLLGFDSSDLQAAVPQLLDGMTTAFLTSVLGLVLALCLRFWASHLAKTEGGTQTASGATITDLATSLASIDRGLATGLGHLRAEMSQVREAIGGQGESTLVGQVKMLRQEQTDASRRMTEVLSDFAAKVSELGSKALIEALKAVIQDFNHNLTEQFGDNFKELNRAVEKLVVWQDNYRTHVMEMEERLQHTAHAIELVQQSITDIAESVTPLPSVNERLLIVLHQIGQETVALEARLAKFAEMGNQAVQAIPIVEANLARLTSGFTDTVSSGLTSLQAVQQEQGRAAAQLHDAFDEVRKEAGAIAASSAEQHRALIKSYSETMGSLENTLREMHSQSARKWQEVLKEQIDKQQDAVRQQLENLNQTLEGQLNATLNQLSQHLLGLHGRLVADYQPLLDSLRGVIESGRRGRPQ